MLVGKNILIVSPEPWVHVFLSKHHYATTLAALGNQVFFLNPPSGSMSIASTKYANLSIIDYSGFIAGLRYLPKYFRKFFQRNKLKNLERLCGCRFEIVWSFDNSVFYDLDLFPSRIIAISHIVDLNQDFEFSRAAISANFCFGCSQVLVDKFKKFNKDSFFVNHGYENQFETQAFKLPSTNRKKVGYAGSLDMKYIDWPLIKSAVRENPEVDFYFAGPLAGSFELKEFKNAHCVGRLEKPVLLGFYREMDALLVAYRVEEFEDQLANPHKIMEYLGSGKPVVATYTKEYAAYPGMLAMALEPEDWCGLLKSVLNDLDRWNETSMVAKRTEFAAENSYKKQIERIESIIFTE